MTRVKSPSLFGQPTLVHVGIFLHERKRVINYIQNMFFLLLSLSLLLLSFVLVVEKKIHFFKRLRVHTIY